MTVKRRGKTLGFQIAESRRRRMKPRSETEFDSTSGAAQIVFREKALAVEGLTLTLDDRAYSFRRCSDEESPALAREDYMGRYECPELETIYTVDVVDDVLVARHFRHGEIPLKPTWPDVFSTDQWFFKPHFTRDEEGRVDGFLLQGSRVLNLRFNRLDPR